MNNIKQFLEADALRTQGVDSDAMKHLIETILAEKKQLRAEIADYEEVLKDKRRLAREIDLALHPEIGAAKQASLCDLVEPARRIREERDLLKHQTKAMQAAFEQVCEKANHVAMLHMCEQEGITSGMPTPQEWMDAVDALHEALATAAPYRKGGV